MLNFLNKVNYSNKTDRHLLHSSLVFSLIHKEKVATSNLHLANARWLKYKV